MEQVVAIIDLKSFYASCECAARGLDPFKTPLVCCDPYRSESSVVMSSSPYLKKKYGIPNVCRKRDLPNVPGMIYAIPRMSYYLEVSSKIVGLFLDYVSYEDIHVYSIDEAFLNIGPYLSYYHQSPEEFVKTLQKAIKRKFGLIATAGIGPNPFLAKIALDNEGKKEEPYLAHWTYEDVPTKLWKIHPLSKIWSIGSQTEKRLKRIGITNLASLAKADPSLLEKNFGIMGLQLRDLANGIDGSDLREEYVPKERSFSSGQTLRKPYPLETTILLLREMNDDLARRLRGEGKKAMKVQFWCVFQKGGGYMREHSLPYPASDTASLFKEIESIFLEGPMKEPVVGIGIAYGRLRTEGSFDQLDLFEPLEEQLERKRLDKALDAIVGMYGKNAVLRASSLKEESTIKDRHEQIGGHRE